MRYIFFIIFLFPAFCFSQSLSSVQDKTKNLAAYKGYFNFYWDDKTGKIFVEVSNLDSEFLYQTSLPAGLGSNDVGLDRGILGTTAIVKFVRSGNKILLVEVNEKFRAVTNDAAEKRAVAQSFASSVLWGFTAEAESNGTVLIDATNFLLRDAMHVSAALKQTGQGNYSVDFSRSALFLERTKDFPFNTDFESTVTFTTNDRPGNFVSSVAPSAETISLRLHHSFIKLPDNNFKPRLYDARCPYSTNTFMDYSTPVTEPIQKYYIIHHRLEKKDPSAKMSEAVKPIVYYLDNGTPEPIRSALLEGAQWWNQAFEAAGYINAFQVKILPDSADPMDIRYNMINWVHRSTRGWSFGAAVVDPRTGEIIKGNVSLGSLRVRQDYLIAQGLLSPFKNGTQVNNKMLQMALQRLKQLAAHEVGHTLGLMHNYISSSQNRASVMDYPPPVVFINNQNEIDLSNAYTNQIGEWDKISIRYGYENFNLKDEQRELDKILKDAAANGFTFISDRDARAAGGLHPNAHLWDVGKNAVTGLYDVMKVREKALAQFGENSIRSSTPMAMLEDVLVPLYLWHRYQLEAVSKIVGGMNYTYAVKGDGQIVTAPISKQEQINALHSLLFCMNPKVLEIPERIIQLIPPRPAGYEYDRELFKRRTGLAFDPLAAAETAADMPLSFLFNTSRLNRMAQYQAENGGLGVDEMLEILFDSLWKNKPATGLQELIRKQNQQLMLTYLLYISVNEEVSFATKAAILSMLEKIKNLATQEVKKAGDKGYWLLILQRIKEPENAKPTLHIDAPPGSPIGCDMD